MAISFDLDLAVENVSRLTSPDAVAAFFQTLGYSTAKRTALTADAIGLQDPDKKLREIQLLSEDAEGFLRVVFVQFRSLTVKARNDLVRVLGKQSQDYLLVLTKNYDAIEFVLIEKVQQQRKGPVPNAVTKARAKVFVVPRRWPQAMLRIVRRLTFTMVDGLQQYDKLKSVFDAAHYSGRYFQNRAPFADHYLETRLREDPAWAVNPGPAFAAVGQLMQATRDRGRGQTEAALRQHLFDPIWKVLGFEALAVKPSHDPVPEPDYRLRSRAGEPRTVALAYAWERWLDGPDATDPETPNENPGAAVVTLLERGDADWVVVTNGKLWRLYSRRAHFRSTNFYEVDLEDALLASGQSDPNEAFRYWWLFFRAEAFAPASAVDQATWLDRVAAGSREYAREVEAELKRRVFFNVVPQLARGFLEDRRTRQKKTAAPTTTELEEIREGVLTLLYRILFLLYAESRDLLPVRESPYYALSLKRMKEEIAEAAGIAETDADERLVTAYKRTATTLYDRLGELFADLEAGNAAANLPTYNGGLFRIKAAEGTDIASGEREAAVAHFLAHHKVPDTYLAAGIDHLSRVMDDKTTSLAFVDYKSLGVRQLGSIYEGLLEFKLKIAEEDLTSIKEKGSERVIPLSLARGKKKAEVAVKQGDIYLANDKSERKATGSYYTPDSIVQYIVANTVGPVLARRLEALRPEFRTAGKTYDTLLKNAHADPSVARKKPNPHAQALSATYDRHCDLVEKLFNLKVLDPAMGSGHFLVESVDFVTDKLIDFLNAFPNNPVIAGMQRTRESILQSLREQGIDLDTDDAVRRQLTDVHLLKRHVLKRCIYGVDLNPLATELAKVSLWLDAFTLGAPLSFLDHHLRTGNSLIGSSITELDTVVYDQIFKIDYQPMMLAIGDVLQVASLADATAAEAHQSADLFAKARQRLSGFRIVLDILVVTHFGVPLAQSLLIDARHLDLKTRDAFLQSLRPRDRKLVDQVEELQQQRRFFHWDLEFPEAFFQYRDESHQQIERRPIGEAGFNVIIGNPPYIRGDILDTLFKEFLKKTASEIYDGSADIFAFFFRLALKSIQHGGRLGLIVQDSLLQVPALSQLRSQLLKAGAVTEILDFGASRPFEDADVRPTIVIGSGEDSSVANDAAYIQLASPLPATDLAAGAELSKLSQNQLRLAAKSGWSMRSFKSADLLARLCSRTQPLRRQVTEPYRGITTGANDVFVIDSNTAEQIASGDTTSRSLIKPFIEGPDISPFMISPPSKHLLFVRRGTEIREYPAALKYLSRFKDRLTPRKGSTSDGGRKPGSYEWYEIQDSTAYYKVFEAAKILYPDTVKGPRFALSSTPLYCGNTVYVIPSADLGLLGVLNSSATWFFIASRFQSRDERAGRLRFRLLVQDVQQLPIPDKSHAGWSVVRQRCQSVIEAIERYRSSTDSKLSAARQLVKEGYAALDEAVFDLYDLSSADRRAILDSIDPEFLL